MADKKISELTERTAPAMTDPVPVEVSSVTYRVPVGALYKDAPAQTLTDGASIAWDVDSGVFATVTLGGNRTLANPTNLGSSGTLILKVVQDGTGSRTLAFGANYLWPGGSAPTLSTDADAVDVLFFVTDGTYLYGKQFGGGGGLVPGGRLTLTSSTPVTTSDVTEATTIYYTPYVGNKININGTEVTFTEKSVSVPSTTTTPFDIFGYISGGELVLETLDWTNDTTRATGIAIAGDGRYYKSGDTTRLYLGTGRTTSVSGQTEDSQSSRLLWNMYNRVAKDLLAQDTTSDWTYTTSTWRAARADTTVGTSRVEVVIGVADTLLDIAYKIGVSNSSNISVSGGIGINSTSSNSAQLHGMQTSSSQHQNWSTYKGLISVGYSYIQALEYSSASGTTTWVSKPLAAIIQSGLSGNIRC
jgi:hypothetical protein